MLCKGCLVLFFLHEFQTKKAGGGGRRGAVGGWVGRRCSRKMYQIQHQMPIIVMYDHSLTFQPESNIFANLGKEDQKKVRQVCDRGSTLKYISRH